MNTLFAAIADSVARYLYVAEIKSDQMRARALSLIDEGVVEKLNGAWLKDVTTIVDNIHRREIEDQLISDRPICAIFSHLVPTASILGNTFRIFDSSSNTTLLSASFTEESNERIWIVDEFSDALWQQRNHQRLPDWITYIFETACAHYGLCKETGDDLEQFAHAVWATISDGPRVLGKPNGPSK